MKLFTLYLMITSVILSKFGVVKLWKEKFISFSLMNGEMLSCVSLYRLRRSITAWKWVEPGMTVGIVTQLLRHTDVKVTATYYGAFADEDIQKADQQYSLTDIFKSSSILLYNLVSIIANFICS